MITAGNFPVAVPSWYIVPALLCGNTVVWKPAEYAAAWADAFCELFGAAAGCPTASSTGARRRARPPSPGWRRPWPTASSTRSASPARRRSAGRSVSCPAGTCRRLPRTGRQEPDGGHPGADLDLAVEGALFSGFGTAGQRCTSLGTVIVHESVHDEFLRRFQAAVDGAAVGDPTQDVLDGSDARRERFAAALRGLPRAGSSRTTGVAGRSAGSRPTTPGRVSSAIPDGGLFYHPVIVDGVRPRGRAVPGGDLRADRRRHAPTPAWTRRASWPTPRATGCPRRSTPPIRARPSRFRDRIGAGMVSDQQLHLRGRGAPPVRRQRQVGQRFPPVRDLGPRPVHPLAVGQLGLLRQAPEGADGRHRADSGP